MGMKKKLFVCSDMHSFYTLFKEALDKAGFESGNDEHMLVICGDAFDRGDESQQMLDYILSVPNKVLIKGNHEYLFEEMCDRGYPMSHDWHNGTAKTIMDLAPTSKDWDGAIPVAEEKVKSYFDSLVNYFETEHYIFVHSWIPLISKANYRRYEDEQEYNSNWREAHAQDWYKATWGNPFDLAQDGLNQTGKIIVHGHYHNSLGWVYKTHGALSEFGEDAKFDICEHENCIGLDACTAYSGKVNVLVIEDELLEEN